MSLIRLLLVTILCLAVNMLIQIRKLWLNAHSSVGYSSRPPYKHSCLSVHVSQRGRRNTSLPDTSIYTSYLSPIRRIGHKSGDKTPPEVGHVEIRYAQPFCTSNVYVF